MAFKTSSSYASSSSQTNDAPKELLQLLGILKKQQPNPIKLPQQHKEEQEEEEEDDDENPMPQQHVELSQIELIYRAEGNANLVLALPQFKKVLRLPKIQKQQYPNSTEYPLQSQQQQLQQQLEQTDMTSTTTTTGQREKEPQSQQYNKNAVGILTMDHYVAYIDIIRCLLGNEFVYEADVVAVPNPNDRDWINEHIRPYRPVNRLDKEFGGHYGLLLPDATGLPAEFDILFSNLQSTPTPTTREATQCCGSHVGPATAGGDGSSNIFGNDTYAIEIKPKQGWLLPNDVNNLFDIKPTLPVSVPPAVVASSNPFEGPLTISTDKEYFTGLQRAGATLGVATTYSSSLCSLPSGSTSTSSSPSIPAKGNDKKLHLSHDDTMGHNIRCRYCSMQHLKLKQQKINKLGEYCPIDLFSGVPSHMLKALDALLTCPQNNLRIFKNGILIYDDKINRLSKIDEIFTSDQLQIIKHLLKSCLLKEYTQRKEECLRTTDNVELLKQAKNMEKNVHTLIASGIPHSNITSGKRQKINICSDTTEPEVAKINTTQATTTTTVQLSLPLADSHRSASSTGVCSSSTLDVHDCHDCLCSASDVSVQQKKSPEMPTLPKNCVLQKVLHLQLLAKRNFPYMLDHKYQVKMEKSYDSLRKLLKKFAENANKLDTSELESDQQYLLAATALDCSIMVTFRSIEDPMGDDDDHSSLLRNPHVICVNDQKFVTKVTLLDLDPKPDSHFAKYCKQTKEIADVLMES